MRHSEIEKRSLDFKRGRGNKLQCSQPWIFAQIKAAELSAAFDDIFARVIAALDALCQHLTALGKSFARILSGGSWGIPR